MTDRPYGAANSALRTDILITARTWLTTPYQHQTSCRGAGCDCLGFLRGVWRDIYGDEPEEIPAYTADWAEPSRQERLRDAAQRNLIALPMNTAQSGDVLLFRMRSGHPAKHLGILSSTDHIIHAYTGHGVVETALGDAWRRRIAYAFAFPKL